MKKIYFYSVLAIVLLIVAVWITLSQKSSTIKPGLRDFAVEDTSLVDKIFMANKEGNTLLLERQKEYWKVNGKYEARKDLIDLLLYTMNRLSVISPVSKAEAPYLIKKMAAKSIKVEIYQKGKLFKTYYVGGPTQNSMGTYMILEGSSMPFVMGIREFRGYIAARYVTSETEWKSMAVFRTPILKIKEVELEYPSQLQKSVKIEQMGVNDFKLSNPATGSILNKFDTNKVVSFLSNFKKIYISSFVEGKGLELRDSLLALKPMLVIKLTDLEQKTKQIKLYKRQREKNPDNPLELLDVDHMFGFINNDSDFVMVQYFVFDPIMKDFNYFRQ